ESEREAHSGEELVVKHDDGRRGRRARIERDGARLAARHGESRQAPAHRLRHPDRVTATGRDAAGHVDLAGPGTLATEAVQVRAVGRVPDDALPGAVEQPHIAVRVTGNPAPRNLVELVVGVVAHDIADDGKRVETPGERGAAAAGIEQARHTVDRVALRLEPPGRGLGTTARRGQHRDGECEYGAAGGSHSILRGFLLETWRRDRPGCVAIARNAHHGAEMPRGYAGLPATFRPPAVG